MPFPDFPFLPKVSFPRSADLTLEGPFVSVRTFPTDSACPVEGSTPSASPHWAAWRWGREIVAADSFLASSVSFHFIILEADGMGLSPYFLSSWKGTLICEQMFNLSGLWGKDPWRIFAVLPCRWYSNLNVVCWLGEQISGGTDV